MAAKKKEEEGPVGIVMTNEEVAGFTKRHGPALFSKPHGSKKTILYYADEAKLKEEAREALGFNRRPAAVFRGRRGAEVERLGNPNTALKEAKIINKGDLDKEVTEIEEEVKEEKEEGTSAAERVKDVEQKELKKTPDEALGIKKDEPEKLAVNASGADREKAAADKKKSSKK